MTEKPSTNEQEYFAKTDAELIQRQRQQMVEAAAEAERKTHYMKCPKCGYDLGSEELHGVQIDRCPHCHGIWLDNGELEALLKHDDPGFAGRLLRDLFASLRRKPSS